MNITKFTEFSEEISSGLSIILQVPEDEDMPVKIIFMAGGRNIQMDFEEFRQICRVVIDGLQQSARKTDLG